MEAMVSVSPPQGNCGSDSVSWNEFGWSRKQARAVGTDVWAVIPHPRGTKSIDSAVSDDPVDAAPDQVSPARIVSIADALGALIVSW